MNHRLIAIVICLLIIAAVVGGVVYWQWPRPAPEDSSRRPASAVDRLTEATSSLLQSFPTPTAGPPAAEGAPVIIWTPGAVTETVLAGTSTSVMVSFIASEDIEGAVVRVVPELIPYVQANPSSFLSVRKGTTVNVELTIGAPVLAAPGTFKGTIQLKRRSGSGTYAKPLPLTVRLAFAVEPPPSFVGIPAIEGGEAKILFYDNPDSASSGVAPIFAVHVDPLPAGRSLLDWVRSFGVEDGAIEEVSIGGRTYLRWFESLGDGMGATSYSTLLSNSEVISVTSLSMTFAASPTFIEIVSSLQLATP